MRPVRIAVATCDAVPTQFDDDRALIEALTRRGVQAEQAVWDDPRVEWSSFDRVVIRSTWDYPRKRATFLEWVQSLAGRVDNEPSLVGWNTDKRYLVDLAAAGLPVVPTTFVARDDEMPRFHGEVVVKPAVSAGARDTGRFGPGSYGLARALIARLHEEGRVAMVQPYLREVERGGELAVAFVAGSFSHALGKRAVLRPDEVAPLRADRLGAAEAMYDSDLVARAEASESARALAESTVRFVARRFGADPLYARVDLVDGPEGPVLLELEAVEPCLYLSLAAGAADRLADAVVANIGR